MITAVELTWIWGGSLLFLWSLSVIAIVILCIDSRRLKKYVKNEKKLKSQRNSIDYHIRRPNLYPKTESVYTHGNADIPNDEELSRRGFTTHISNPNMSRNNYTNPTYYSDDFEATPVQSPLGMPGKRKQIPKHEQQMTQPKNILAQHNNFENNSNVPENDNFFY